MNCGLWENGVKEAATCDPPHNYRLIMNNETLYITVMDRGTQESGHVRDNLSQY